MFHKRQHFYLLFILAFSCSDCDEPNPVPNPFSTQQAKPGEDGSKCFFDNECDSGKCDTSFNLGYCSSDNCDDGCIGDDAFCLNYLSGREQCVDGCKSSAECRGGYDCIQVYNDKSACLQKQHQGPTSGELGASCEEMDCHPGLTCLALNEKGYCAGDCSDCEDGLCQKLEDGSEVCLATCMLSEECQLNDICRDGACHPQIPDTADSNSDDVFGVMCDFEKVSEFTYEFEFKLKQDTQSFSLTTLLSKGNLKIVEIEKDGTPFGMGTTYRHHNQRILGIERYPAQFGSYGTTVFDWTVVVPYAPQFSGLVDTNAEYVLRVESPIEPPCVYLLESSGGTKLSIDLYFASDLFSAKNAATNTDLQEILSVLKSLYQKADIEIDQIRYHDLSAPQKERFSKTRSSDVRALTALGQAQGESLNDHLSIDVFMVDDIIGGAAGVSPSIPGPPGLHGNPNNGLVFSVVDAGFDNEVIGYIMAHEIGHYLGLRHTSEKVIGETREYIDELVDVLDPILDTPGCVPTDEICPDESNLMFPSIPDKDARAGDITPGQAAALKANPLIRK